MLLGQDDIIGFSDDDNDNKQNNKKQEDNPIEQIQFRGNQIQNKLKTQNQQQQQQQQQSVTQQPMPQLREKQDVIQASLEDNKKSNQYEMKQKFPDQKRNGQKNAEDNIIGFDEDDPSQQKNDILQIEDVDKPTNSKNFDNQQKKSNDQEKSLGQQQQQGSNQVESRTQKLSQYNELIKERQKMQFQEQGIQQNQLFKGNSLTSDSSYYGNNINFDSLQKIVKNNSANAQYEPGQGLLQQNANDLPVLSKEVNAIKFKDQEIVRQKQFEDNYDDLQQKMKAQKISNKKELEQIQISDEENNGGDKQKQVSKKQADDNEDGENELQKGQKKGNQADNNQYEEEKDEDEDEEEHGSKDNNQEDDNQESDIEDNKNGVQNDAENQKKDGKQQANQHQQPTNVVITSLESLNIKNMMEFLQKPLPKGINIQCTIQRDKSGMNRFHPKYHLYFSYGFKYLMSARKRSFNKTSNYLIAADKSNLNKNSKSFLGKVRSNFLGTEFVIYDIGNNPKKSKGGLDHVRKELGVVMYESNLLGARGPRKMRVLIPEMKQNDEPYEWKPMKQEDSMAAKFKNGSLQGVKFFYNKPPKWNDHVQAFVLNFQGRVEKPSVKNFQLINNTDEDNVLMQFGRMSDEVFNMDVSYPFSLLQAFGICLSSFDYKIACE